MAPAWHEGTTPPPCRPPAAPPSGCVRGPGRLRSSLLWGSHPTQGQQAVTHDPALQPDAPHHCPVTLATPWPPAAPPALLLPRREGALRLKSPLTAALSSLLWAVALLPPACRGAERVSLAGAAGSSPPALTTHLSLLSSTGSHSTPRSGFHVPSLPSRNSKQMRFSKCL